MRKKKTTQNEKDRLIWKKETYKKEKGNQAMRKKKNPIYKKEWTQAKKRQRKKSSNLKQRKKLEMCERNKKCS